jgi:FtsP/CotA-like multicopper oxidase with cupredoxin domain
MSAIGDPPPVDSGAHWQEFVFAIDGKRFDPARIDQRKKLGAVEEWTIRNTYQRDDHMFHISVGLQILEGKHLLRSTRRAIVLLDTDGLIELARLDQR